MQGNASDVFNEPAVKLLCRQLKDCQCQSSPASGLSNQRWLVPLKSSITGKEIRYPVLTVWLQGTIHNIINESHLILKDVSGGIVKIADYNKMVGASDWICRGNELKLECVKIKLIFYMVYKSRCVLLNNWIHCVI